jgi:hypothetical protein
MAFPSSGLFVQTFLSALNGGIVLDLDVLTHKVALYTNAMTTADLVTDTAYNVGAWATANEVVGTGYTAGGYTLANTTYTHTGTPTTGVVMWDNTVDPNWSTATITARGALYYADALAGNNAIVAQTFGADITSTAGTFTIQLASAGIFTIDFIP